MAKNGHSDFFPTNMGNKNAQKWAFQIYSKLFGAERWKKFGMAKNGHSEFI